MKKFIFAVAFVFLVVPVVFSQTVTTLSDEFNGSGGIAVDAEGNIYVADFGDLLSNANGTTVWKITPDGVRTEFATGLQGASGNTFGPDGNLYQSNIAGNRISVITPEGMVSTLENTLAAAPVGLDFDAQGNLYIANCGNRSIRKVTPEGESSLLVRNNLLFCPNGLAVDDQDNVYAGTFNGGRVLKVTPDGTLTILATVPGGAIGHLTFANGRLYVVARNDNSVYELTLEGELTKIAGTGERGNADGPASEATFSLPNGIAASPDGTKLYINSKVNADDSNQSLNPVLVRVIHLDNADESEAQADQPALTFPTLWLNVSSTPARLALDQGLRLVTCAVACLAGKAASFKL